MTLMTLIVFPLFSLGFLFPFSNLGCGVGLGPFKTAEAINSNETWSAYSMTQNVSFEMCKVDRWRHISWGSTLFVLHKPPSRISWYFQNHWKPSKLVQNLSSKEKKLLKCPIKGKKKFKIWKKNSCQDLVAVETSKHLTNQLLYQIARKMLGNRRVTRNIQSGRTLIVRFLTFRSPPLPG